VIESAQDLGGSGHGHVQLSEMKADDVSILGQEGGVVKEPLTNVLQSGRVAGPWLAKNGGALVLGYSRYAEDGWLP
jgi:hypothetical protein